MIPVTAQPEPAHFHTAVRQRGRSWLLGKGIALHGAAPKGTKFPPYWTATNKDLWDAYSGICAYLAIYFEFPIGSRKWADQAESVGTGGATAASAEDD